jgi:hypothetical protein
MQANPYVEKPVLHLDGSMSQTIKCRKHPGYSVRVREPKCEWCRALFWMVKVRASGEPRNDR